MTRSPRSSESRAFPDRYGRFYPWFAGALSFGLFVPALFFVLPPSPGDAIDRWFVAGFCGVVALVAGVLLQPIVHRSALPLKRRILLGAIALASLVFTSLVGARSETVHNRRYCEAHQRYARRNLKDLVAKKDYTKNERKRLVPLPAQTWSPDPRDGGHFTYSREPSADGGGFRVIALGTGFQDGCAYALSDGDELSAMAFGLCQDICF